MIRRSLCTIGILLFLLLAVSCQKAVDASMEDINTLDDGKDNSSTPDHGKEEGNPKESHELSVLYNDEQPMNDMNEGNNLYMDHAKEGDIILEENHAIMVMDILNTYSAEDLAGVMKAFPAGSRIDTKGSIHKELYSLFYYHEITSEIKERINGKSYGEDCTVPYEELRYIRVLHVGFDGNTYIGELIVNKALAKDVLEIFWELYELRYPIERMVLIDEYEANDDLSMAANNSSAFNFRHIAGTKRLSLHSQGLAIDINPLYNPYITQIDGVETVLPGEAIEHIDRTIVNPYYIRSGDPCYEAFIRRGFTWGGEWKNSKDYQHFQKVLEE